MPAELERILADPTLTQILLGICLVVSIPGFFLLRSRRYRRYVVYKPCRAAPDRSVVGTLLSHFAHGDLGHLALNLFALYVFGPKVEAELGPQRFLVIYVLSGAAATLFIWLFRRRDPRSSSLGASGSIAGILFAFVVLAPQTKLALLFLPIPAPAPLFALGYLLFSSLSMGSRDGVAHEAHIGGALAGFALAGLLADRGFTPVIRELQRIIS
ncbi:MAG: rhomboid family intramembrane serine protease [Myxococcales bacterium]|nr:rhomboid family intramembrane serine protease [Myxococcales bacterium]